MAELEFRDAIREGLDEELERDERVVFFGEDVAVAGGVFADFLPLVMDSLINQATKYWYISKEQSSVPLVVRSSCGAGGRFGAIHSQTPVSWLLGVPGLKIVAPATPADAKG